MQKIYTADVLPSDDIWRYQYFKSVPCVVVSAAGDSPSFKTLMQHINDVFYGKTPCRYIVLTNITKARYAKAIKANPTGKLPSVVDLQSDDEFKIIDGYHMTYADACPDNIVGGSLLFDSTAVHNIIHKQNKPAVLRIPTKMDWTQFINFDMFEPEAKDIKTAVEEILVIPPRVSTVQKYEPMEYKLMPATQWVDQDYPTGLPETDELTSSWTHGMVSNPTDDYEYVPCNPILDIQLQHFNEAVDMMSHRNIEAESDITDDDSDMLMMYEDYEHMDLENLDLVTESKKIPSVHNTELAESGDPYNLLGAGVCMSRHMKFKLAGQPVTIIVHRYVTREWYICNLLKDTGVFPEIYAYGRTASLTNKIVPSIDGFYPFIIKEFIYEKAVRFDSMCLRSYLSVVDHVKLLIQLLLTLAELNLTHSLLHGKFIMSAIWFEPLEDEKTVEYRLGNSTVRLEHVQFRIIFDQTTKYYIAGDTHDYQDHRKMSFANDVLAFMIDFIHTTTNIKYIGENRELDIGNYKISVITDILNSITTYAFGTTMVCLGHDWKYGYTVLPANTNIHLLLYELGHICQRNGLGSICPDLLSIK